MYKIVIDTNVLISAIVFGGKPRHILELIIEGKIRLVISESILEEVKAVLGGKKFQYPPKILHTIIAEIGNISEFVEPKIKINTITKDPDDNKILECAFEARADFIVSGDNHLLEIGAFKGIEIMSPSDFIKDIILVRSKDEKKS